MDTICDDLFIIIANHFDVLPTVFLTSSPINLEDADESVYERQIWPWLLHDIRKSYEYIFMCALKDNDNLGVLKCINQSWRLLSGPVIDNIYIEAHRYNNKQVIEATKKYLYDSDYAHEYAMSQAALGGHLELFNDLNNSQTDKLYVPAHRVKAAYEGGHSNIIETEYVQNGLEFHYSSAILGAIAGNHLELMKELITQYGSRCVNISIISFGPNTFHTFKYLLENNIVSISKNKEVNFQVFIRMITEKAPIKLFEWFLFDWMKEQVDITRLVKYCILLNNIHYIKRLIPSNYQTADEQLRYLFEHYKLEKDDMEYLFSRTSLRIGCRAGNRRFLNILRSKTQ